jgi:hypothetical protein
MMKGTPCSARRRASLKTLWKTRYSDRVAIPRSGFVHGGKAVIQELPDRR